MQAFYEKYRGQTALLTINIGDSAEKVKAFMAEGGYSLPVLLDTGGEVARAYRVNGVPSTFLVDSRGNLAGYYPGLLTMDVLEGLTRKLE